MVRTRSYGEGCPVAHALDLIGERWALLVLRELRLGPKRFTDLQASLLGAGPNVLAHRLRELERVGVLRRRTLAPPAGSRVYELTEWGAELEPVFGALARWGMRSPIAVREGPLSADSVMLGLRTFFAPDAEQPWTASYEVRLGRDRYTVRVVEGRLTEVTRGEPRDDPDTTLEADRMTFHAVLTGARSVQAAVEDGDLSVAGDAVAARRLVDAVRM